jgi:hypothetical protein
MDGLQQDQGAPEHPLSAALKAPLSFSSGPAPLFRSLMTPVSCLENSRVCVVDMAVFLHAAVCSDTISQAMARSHFDPNSVAPEDVVLICRELASLVRRLLFATTTLGATATM